MQVKDKIEIMIGDIIKENIKLQNYIEYFENHLRKR